MNATITQDTKGAGLDALIKRVKGAADAAVRVGVPSGVKAQERQPDNTIKDGPADLALVAAVNEFGAPEVGIPERPFLRRGIIHARADARRLNRVSLWEVLHERMTLRAAMEKLGVFMVGSVQKEITDGEFAPNAPSTAERKGSTHPLIDTGQLRQSITYQVEGVDD